MGFFCWYFSNTIFSRHFRIISNDWFSAIVVHCLEELFVVCWSSFSISCPCLRAKVAWPWATILFLVVLSYPRVFLRAQSFPPISSWCRYPCKSGIWPFWCTSCTSWSSPIVPASTFHQKFVEAKIVHTASNNNTLFRSVKYERPPRSSEVIRGQNASQFARFPTLARVAGDGLYILCFWPWDNLTRS